MAQVKTIYVAIGLSLLLSAIYAIAHLYIMTQAGALTSLTPYIQIASTFLVLTLILTLVLYNAFTLINTRQKKTN
jgi:hypothetical protein